MESLHTFREIIEMARAESRRIIETGKPLTAMTEDELAELARYINRFEAAVSLLARYAREEEEAQKEAMRHFK